MLMMDTVHDLIILFWCQLKDTHLHDVHFFSRIVVIVVVVAADQATNSHPPSGSIFALLQTL